VAADPRPVVRLARLFRQRGVVVVSRHQAARLVLLEPFPLPLARLGREADQGRGG
jgi:hypothetical protein